MRARPQPACQGESGQAAVESAIVIPLMVFLILGIIQLVMVQHARVMTEYAAFNAARAGIVWNADRVIMENAAIISLLPTYEGLINEADQGNPAQMVKRVLQRALLYQINRRLPQAIDLLENGANKIIAQVPIGGAGRRELNKIKDDLLDQAQDLADTALQKAISQAVGGGDDRLVSITIESPTPSSFSRGQEIDFDDYAERDTGRLIVTVRYLYMMRVPFANWVIHQAWMAAVAGKRLYGAVWNPQENARGESGFRSVSPVTAPGSGEKTMKILEALAEQGIYMVPLTTTYTMRMQSNPYRQSLQVQ